MRNNEILTRAKAGNEVAIQTILNENKNRVLELATWYANNSNTSLSVDELAEEGTKALRDAINSYHADKGIPFTAHSFFIIRDYMKDAVLVNLMNTINSMAA